MTLLWPWAPLPPLALALALALLLGWRARARGRRAARAAVLHPDAHWLAGGLRTARGKAAGRLAPGSVATALYAAAALVTLLALARPAWPVPEAHPAAGVVLAVDASWSMRAEDIDPTRFEAAREAVREFVGALPRGARVALLSFGSYPVLISPLTDDHARLLEAVEALALRRGTAIGEALRAALEALPPLEEREALGDPEKLATIILLSDGRNRSGVHPFEVLELLRRERVTVHTVGIGTEEGGTLPGLDPRFGDVLRFDEATLRRLADDSGGRYLYVDSAASLRDAYRELGGALAWRTAREEATALASLAAAALLAGSLALAAFARRVG